MGEVAGKGIRTALIMADVQLEIRRLLLAGLEFPDVLSRVNWLLADAGGEGNCVSVALAGLDSQAHRLTVVSAGHDPLVVRRATGLIENLDRQQAAVGPPLGSSPAPFYRAITVSLAPGDWVFLVSNASTRDLIYSWRYFGFEGCRDTETPGATMIGGFRQRASSHPPATDVAIFCFGASASDAGQSSARAAQSRSRWPRRVPSFRTWGSVSSLNLGSEDGPSTWTMRNCPLASRIRSLTIGK